MCADFLAKIALTDHVKKGRRSAYESVAVLGIPIWYGATDSLSSTRASEENINVCKGRDRKKKKFGQHYYRIELWLTLCYGHALRVRLDGKQQVQRQQQQPPFHKPNAHQVSPYHDFFVPSSGLLCHQISHALIYHRSPKLVEFKKSSLFNGDANRTNVQLWIIPAKH